MSEPGPALGLLELTTIARGVIVADAALKRAPAILLSSRTLSGGKHLVVLEGGVAEVAEAMAAGIAIAGDKLRDRVELAYADAQVWPMLVEGGLVSPPEWDDESVAIIETATVCAAIAAADAACKAADVYIRDVRLAIDLAGKAVFTLTGALSAVDAAADAAREAAGDRLVDLERIAQPAPELRGKLFR